ncbi:lipopolysaccharide biosynthesis protein [Paenibacillus protaetiae]|uniref:Lipopolysaccharide biosynthesis protein n=2 Tax=Paenibacillus protaetiae TaxID=2509456 RepID=A0A4P6FDC5_9BACL|nr:lipopolysaccharide biosynthesis protein [Paenibacillus protaetiae]
MILARLLAPEAFGVVATVTMIVSFADIFTDAGFQKYLIQQEFSSNDEVGQASNVAFWTNLVISLLLWCTIFTFNEQLASLLGNPGLGMVLVIASFQLPLTSFSSIQSALFKRSLDFRILFIARIISSCIPFVVTIPFALIGFGYWAIVIGTIVSQLSTAVILTYNSSWKPTFYFSLTVFKKMFSFSMWSLFESISIWLTSWVDVLLISTVLNSHYVGLYKTSSMMVNGLMTLITSTTVPVLFSVLSRLQNQSDIFTSVFLKAQRLVAVVVLPLGVGIYLYRDLITLILLGNKWIESSDILGQWALTSAVTIVFGHICSEVYRAKGLPKLSFLVQILHLIVLVPACIFSLHYGFWVFVYVRSWIRIQSVVVHFIIMRIKVGIIISTIVKNTFTICTAAFFMGVIGYIINGLHNSTGWTFFSVSLCAIIYLGILLLFSKTRKDILYAIGLFKSKLS